MRHVQLRNLIQSTIHNGIVLYWMYTCNCTGAHLTIHYTWPTSLYIIHGSHCTLRLGQCPPLMLSLQRFQRAPVVAARDVALSVLLYVFCIAYRVLRCFTCCFVCIALRVLRCITCCFVNCWNANIWVELWFVSRLLLLFVSRVHCILLYSCIHCIHGIHCIHCILYIRYIV